MKLLLENWRQYLHDPAEAVIEALRDLGSEVDGQTVYGPSPLKTVALSTQHDGVIWIHWVEGEQAGAGAWEYLREIISQAAPEAPIALEANYVAAPFWLKQGFDEITVDEAEEIYPNIEPDNRFFWKEKA